jgi:hypothetical protein
MDQMLVARSDCITVATLPAGFLTAVLACCVVSCQLNYAAGNKKPDEHYGQPMSQSNAPPSSMRKDTMKGAEMPGCLEARQTIKSPYRPRTCNHHRGNQRTAKPNADRMGKFPG